MGDKGDGGGHGLGGIRGEGAGAMVLAESWWLVMVRLGRGLHRGPGLCPGWVPQSRHHPAPTEPYGTGLCSLCHGGAPPPPPTVDHPAKVGPSWSHTWVWVPAAPHTLCLSLVGPWGSRAVGKGLWGGGCEGAWC